MSNAMRIVEIGDRFESSVVMKVANEPTKARLTVFDLSAVARIDWMALAMLADCRQRMRSKGGELALVGVGARLQDALRRLGLQETVPVYDSVASAKAALAFGFSR